MEVFSEPEARASPLAAGSGRGVWGFIAALRLCYPFRRFEKDVRKKSPDATYQWHPDSSDQKQRTNYGFFCQVVLRRSSSL